eukprot:CAMPEP_0198644980 /NCGR_PEP_ID=MMETSP1467-20131203/969_1 /TAXON_ID=1462469 /ORGANISM="unid. sp., Strain CCMP2135" /LENGTH=277 /DNA_ID=CAMNT_0044380453 /DNA_START=6 /DNA_END=839 /DNA_ORIENTATION=+
MSSYDEAVTKIFEERLTTFYRKYDASKVGSVKSLLAKYKGNEEKLIRAMVAKYGPEPTPEELDDDDDDDEEDDEEGVAESKEEAAKTTKNQDALPQQEDDDDDDDDEEDDDDESRGKPLEYCGVCGLPAEYCEYSAEYEKCVPWLKEHAPEMLVAHEEESGGAKKKKRGGGVVKKKELSEDKARVLLYTEVRSRKKTVTVVDGLETVGVKLKEAAKLFGRKFAASSSVKDKDTGGLEVVIQGDALFDLPDLLKAEYGVPAAKLFTKDPASKKIVPLR